MNGKVRVIFTSSKYSPETFRKAHEKYGLWQFGELEEVFINTLKMPGETVSSPESPNATVIPGWDAPAKSEPVRATDFAYYLGEVSKGNLEALGIAPLAFFVGLPVDKLLASKEAIEKFREEVSPESPTRVYAAWAGGEGQSKEALSDTLPPAPVHSSSSSPALPLPPSSPPPPTIRHDGIGDFPSEAASLPLPSHLPLSLPLPLPRTANVGLPTQSGECEGQIEARGEEKAEGKAEGRGKEEPPLGITPTASPSVRGLPPAPEPKKVRGGGGGGAGGSGSGGNGGTKREKTLTTGAETWTLDDTLGGIAAARRMGTVLNLPELNLEVGTGSERSMTWDEFAGIVYFLKRFEKGGSVEFQGKVFKVKGHDKQEQG